VSLDAKQSSSVLQKEQRRRIKAITDLDSQTPKLFQSYSWKGRLKTAKLSTQVNSLDTSLIF
jgi:hypothetical protein